MHTLIGTPRCSQALSLSQQLQAKPVYPVACASLGNPKPFLKTKVSVLRRKYTNSFTNLTPAPCFEAVDVWTQQL